MSDIKFLDSAILELLDLKTDSRLKSSMRDQIDHLLSGLRFLQLYAQCLAKWNEALQGKKNRHLGAVRNSQIKATLAGATTGLYSTGIIALATQDYQDWDNLASNLLGGIDHLLSKPKTREDCCYLLDRSFQCRFSSFELQKFFCNLLDNLDEIVRLKSGEVVDIKIQIQGVKEKLHFFGQIFELARKMRSSNKDLKDFNVRIQAWAYKAACVSLLYRVQDENRVKLPNLFSAPEVTRMFLAVLQHLWSLSHNRLLIDEGVPKFVEFLLEILQPIPMIDGIRNLHSNLIFLTTFLVDPPMAEEYKEQAESVAKEVQSFICTLTVEHFEEKMSTIKANVSELYGRIFVDSWSFDFPRTNVLGFLDSLVHSLGEISCHVSNHEVDEMLEEDLLLFMSFLKDLLMKKIDLSEYLWTRIINVVYRVEIVVNMLAALNDCVWYDMKFLSDVRLEINLIKSEVKKFQNEQFHDIIVPNIDIKVSSNAAPFLSADNELRTDEVVVGFEHDFDIIFQQLTGGSSKLTAVSVVGMAGLGKTTLAKKVYSHRLVKIHFHSYAWCHVSPTYQRKRLLLDILNMLVDRHDIFNMEEDDLAQLIYRILKGQRYLIAVDDAWDIAVFDELNYLFPDDNNGSRILLTTRNHKVAEGTNCRNSYTHHLRPLSYLESWDLLQRKIFHKNSCPQIFVEVGRQIARNCNGLPLAVVIIAGLLLAGERNLDWWNHVAENLDSLIASNQGMELVELSYMHLPEHLKPCFLYFGAFQADKVIRARRLIQLWVSEGFVHQSNGKTLEDVAVEYLRDLVSRSLVVVTNTSSTGGIKKCRIDSLFYEFCLAKVKEEKFLQVESGDDLSFESKGTIYKNYRICIQSGGDGFFASNPLGPCVHSLLFVPDYTCLNKGELFSICNFKLLHILDLEDMEFNAYFPEEVTLLVLLRYLAVWCPSGIFSIPPSIANVRKLETFRVKREVRLGDEICLPNSLWTMKKLRHVDIGGFAASFSGEGDPDEESLALDDIRTFSSPSLSRGEDAERLLRRVSKVRKLRCRFDDSHDPHQKQNRFPALDVLSELESLNVRYVGSLFHSCAFNFPSTLRKLTLAQFVIPQSEMSTIARNLHNLEVLKLLKSAFEAKEWNVSDEEFSKLRFLKLCELNIAQWNASDDAFPCLEQLILESCEELEGIPSVFGALCTLKKIQVRWCKPTVADSAREIQEEQYELGNDEIEAHIMDIF